MAKKVPVQFTEAQKRRLTELRAKASYSSPEADEMARLTRLEAEVRAQADADRRKQEEEAVRLRAERELEEARRRGEEGRKRLEALRKQELDAARALLRQPLEMFAPPGEPPEKAQRANAILQVARGALVSADAATAEAQAAKASAHRVHRLLIGMVMLFAVLFAVVTIGVTELLTRRGPSADDLRTMSGAVAEIQSKIEVLYTTSDEECSLPDSIKSAGPGKVKLENCKRVLMRHCTCEASPTPTSPPGQP